MLSDILSDLDVGSKAIIKQINSKDDIKRRLLDIGLVPGTTVKCILTSLSGDFKAYLIKGALIALRKEDTDLIVVGDSNEKNC